LHKNRFWLSETPDIEGSRSWNTAYIRFCQWILFKVKGSSTQFYFFNTHLDNYSWEAKAKGAKLILSKMASIQNTYGKYPIFLTGDMNSLEGFPAYNIFTQANEYSFDPLKDSKYLSKNKPHGPTATFTDFHLGGPFVLIDHIFVRLDDKFKIVNYGVLSDIWDNNYTPSDHRPVVIDVELLNS